MCDPEIQDAEWLRRYADEHSDDAFAVLVQRHFGLVYGTACRRMNGDGERARDVAQAVFVELARQARRLAQHPALTGWLHTTTVRLTLKAIRDDSRRLRRELDSQSMNEPARGEPEADWLALQPVLDEAIQDLGETDRMAVLLRFFEGRSLREVGGALGVSEDAARMRVQRALDRLHGALGRRGIAASAGSLAASLGVHAMPVVPGGLAAQVATAVCTKAAALGASSGFAPTLWTTLLTMKTPLVSACAAAVVIAVPLLVQQSGLQQAEARLAQLEQSMVAAPAADASVPDPGAAPRISAAELEQLRGLLPELERLRAESAQLRRTIARPESAALIAARRSLGEAEAAKVEAEQETELRETRAKVVNNLKHLGLAARIFATDNADKLPESFDAIREILGGDASEVVRALDRFEFYPQPRPISEAEPQLFMFREKSARRRPDGTWERAYALADGSVQTLESPTEDFTAREREARGIAEPSPQGAAVGAGDTGGNQ